MSLIYMYNQCLEDTNDELSSFVHLQVSTASFAQFALFTVGV